jgi:DNA-binding IclR family transcriptional regulator
MPISAVMTAMGRAAAATLPQADAALLEERIASEDTKLWSAFRETYRAGLAQCASRGFCTCYGEYIASIHAVAAPLFHAGEAKQAFSINCGIPAFRLQPRQLEGEIGPRIAALADSIRSMIGAAPATETQKQNKKSARR